MQFDAQLPASAFLGPSLSRPLQPSNRVSRGLTALVALANLLPLLLTVGCGSTGQRTQPPILSYATTNAVYTKGAAITPNVPSDSGGAATSYAVQPALPAGLSLSVTSGVISGTPTAVTAQATYTVTGSNAGGSSTVALKITVNDIAPSGLTYGTNPATYAAAAAISPNAPSWSSSGGIPTGFTVVGQLPAGLSLDPTTGVISGTPTMQTPQANYTITATNTGGSTNTSVTITVIPQAPFISLQPASQYVASGISTILQVNAGPTTSALNYQWFKNGSAIPGSNNLFYVTPVLSNADNGDQFYVVVSDTYSRNATSNVATLTIRGAAGTFVDTGTPSVARSGPSATLLQNGKVLIAGGRSGNDILQSAELYDPVSGSFTPTGTMNVARSGHSATLLQNGKVLIAGGTTTSTTVLLPTTNTAELYDPSTGTFSPTGSLSVSRGGHSATLLASGKVLIASGTSNTNGTFLNLNGAELFDPVAGTFSSTGSLNHAGAGGGVLLNNGHVLFAGGFNQTEGLLGSAELYDPAAGTFSLTGSLNTARSGNSETLLQNGKVLVAGGRDINGDWLASAELYDPSAGTFSATGALNIARTPCATLLPSGQVLLLGGVPSGVTQTVQMSEIYDPATGVFIMNGTSIAVRGVGTLLNNGRVLFEDQGTSAISVTQPIPAELYEP